MDKIRVAIVDDHPIVRDGLAAMLTTKRTFAIEGKYANGDEFLKAAGEKGAVADVVVMDVRMPGHDGLSTLADLKKRFPAVKCILLTGLPLKGEEEEARELGASAYLPKTTDQDRLAALIREVASGSDVFATEDNGTDEEAPNLTRREMQVLNAMSKGYTRDEIGGILGISGETVKCYIKTIMLKLDATNAANAVARAYELGIMR
ncbi:MAG: response regulator transcription factor [Kiritimatiellae bacterium]|nr:response regulator transcription factor [Kiritimatiellia bacterium]